MIDNIDSLDYIMDYFAVSITIIHHYIERRFLLHPVIEVPTIDREHFDRNFLYSAIEYLDFLSVWMNWQFRYLLPMLLLLSMILNP